MPGIVTRQLRAEEAGLLRGLRLAALSDAPEMFAQSLDDARGLSEADWVSRSERYAGGTEGVCFVAERGRRAVGMTYGFLDKERSDVVRVGGMWVVADVRREGIGAALLARVRTWAADRGRTELRLHVFHGGGDAQLFYRSQGFKPLTSEPDDAGFLEFYAPVRNSSQMLPSCLLKIRFSCR